MEEARAADSMKDWSSAKNWAQWWTRSTHLKMLSVAFTELDGDIWQRSPTSTNAVERRNRDCKSNAVSIKQIMIQVYKVDKVVCMKHISAEEGGSITYRSRSEEARAAEAKSRQACRVIHSEPDKESSFGPPDKATNYNSRKRKSSTSSTPKPKKSCIEVDNKKVHFVPNPRPEVIGKQVKMKFQIVESDISEWFQGIISSYDGVTQKYGIYFPSDEETVYTSLDDEDLEFLESNDDH